MTFRNLYPRNSSSFFSGINASFFTFFFPATAIQGVIFQQAFFDAVHTRLLGRSRGNVKVGGKGLSDRAATLKVDQYGVTRQRARQTIGDLNQQVVARVGRPAGHQFNLLPLGH